MAAEVGPFLLIKASDSHGFNLDARKKKNMDLIENILSVVLLVLFYTHECGLTG